MESDLPLHLLATFHQHFPSESPQWIVRPEGYNVWIAATFDDAPEFTLVSADQNMKTVFSFQSAKRKQTVLKRPLPRWARHAAGVYLRLYERDSANPLIPRGIRAAVISLESAGPRYEYSIGMAIAALWSDILNAPPKSDNLRDIVDKVQREYID